jgi:hypothetical protein
MGVHSRLDGASRTLLRNARGRVPFLVVVVERMWKKERRCDESKEVQAQLNGVHQRRADIILR